MKWFKSFINCLGDDQVTFSKRNTDDMLKSTEPVVQNFAKAMQKNLDELGGPKQLFGTDILPRLLDLVIEYLEGCLRIRSSKAIARDMANPRYGQELKLERRLARKVFHGRKNYEENKGRNTFEALLKTSSEAKPEQMIELVDYVRNNDIPEVEPGEIPIYLPEL